MRRTATSVAVLVALLIGALLYRSHNAAPKPPYDPKPLAIEPPSVSPPGFSLADLPATRHLEYVFPDGGVAIYDADRGFHPLERISLPQAKGIRGVAVSPRRHELFVSYGGDGDGNGHGNLLAYDLLAQRILWAKGYPTGIDSMALSPDGRTMYMPTGELAGGGTWDVIDTRTGRVTAAIDGPKGPHNTAVSPDGKRVYLGGRNGDRFEVADAATHAVVLKTDKLESGVRPFAVGRAGSVAYTTATGFLGFQVSDLHTGKVLWTVPLAGFSYDPKTFPASAPSHGIALSPDERRIWVIDAPNSRVHVFDVFGTRARPKHVADLRLPHAMVGNESPCTYDCARDGWLQFSIDGRFVYVGDSGDVFDAQTLKPVAFISALRNTRKMLEVDWAGGKPVAATPRSGPGILR